MNVPKMKPSVHYHVGVMLLLVTALAACGRQVVEFEIDAGPGAPPTVTSNLPANNAIGVAVATPVSATFSKPMDETTLTTSTVTVKQGTTAVPGSVAYAPATRTVTFVPSAALENALPYTATVTTGARDTEGLALAANNSWTFTTIAHAPPTVSSTTPGDAEMNVSTNKNPTATFSQAMDATTITPDTFTVQQGSTPVPGAVSFQASTNTATFVPTVALGDAVVYTATITTGAKDSKQFAIAANYSWTFTTAAAQPIVLSTLPLDHATGIALNASASVKFSKAMNPATLTSTTFTVKQGATSVSGAVSLDSATNTATFNPAADLANGLVYTATLTTGAQSSNGVGLAADYVWSFTTVAASPTVLSTLPANNATGIAVNNSITATFSKAMDPTTVQSLTFTVKQGATSVAGLVTLDGATNTATFNPGSALGNNLIYTATITTGAKDQGGLPLSANHSWTFTTIDGLPTVLSTVPLNNAIGVPLNASVTATFNKAMDSATITDQTFTLKQGAVAIAGTVTLNGATNTTTFNPTAALTNNLVYTATVTTGAKDVGGLALASAHVWTFTATDSSPTVLSTLPVNADIGVPVNTSISATFSKPMDAMTIHSLTFKVKVGMNTVPGLVTLDGVGTKATFVPATQLTNDTVYTVTITTGVRDAGGIALASDYTWNFITVAASPTVLSIVPINAAIGVALNTPITATFSTAMDSNTITDLTFIVTQGLTTVLGVVTYDALTDTASFAPAMPLMPSKLYTATITTDAQDLAGNGLAMDFVWTWTTGLAPDIQPPTVTLTDPPDLATNVPVTKTIKATFSEEMKQTTMVTTNFTVKETASNNPVLGTVSYDVQNNVMAFSPDNDLLPDTDYTVTVLNGAKDLAGNAVVVPAVLDLPKPNPWSFHTKAVIIVPPPLAVNLRSAASFGVASRAGLTSTGITVVNGDVALHPLAGCTDSTGNAGASQDCLVKTYSSPTGLTVNGSIYWAGDPFDNGGTANSVTNDLNIAWTEGQNKADTAGVVAGDEIGGKTFLPGVYHNATLGMAAGQMATMDAQNDSNAVFFFKVDSSFVDSGTLLLPTSIVLINGAKARNVWFITGLDATIGSGTTWNGNILAGRTATILDGSAVMGRVLAGASGAGALTLTGAASPSLTSVTVPQ